MGYQVNYSARNFSKGTKALAFHRAHGRCVGCGLKLTSGNINYDHRIPWEICHHSGPSNCQVLCRTCHGVKTSTIDVPDIRRGDRIRMLHIGADGPGLGRHPLPGGRRAPFKIAIGGGRKPRLPHAERHRAFIERRYGCFNAEQAEH